MAVSKDRSIQLNPMFPTPPGVVGASSLSDVSQEYFQSVEEELDYGDYANESEVPDDVNASSGDPSVTPPGSMTIISQRVTIGADGTSMTDVVVEFPDAAGMFDLEVRSSKL